MENTVLVLDAMGVIFAAADDVEELLVPFIVENGGLDDGATVARQYTRASLGEIDAATFWHAVGLSPRVEDEYLSHHCVTEGLLTFLDNRPACVSSVWCLSNDVGQWSRKLRSLHGLESRFDGFVISGDVGVRKPQREIYDRLLESVGCPANTILFVDDRPKNLDAAQSLGFRTIQFNPMPDGSNQHKHARIHSFNELIEDLES